MPYAAVRWKVVSVLLRDSSYSIIEALTAGPKKWVELRDAAQLTDGGLQKVLKDLMRFGIVEQKLIGKAGTGKFQEKRYVLSKAAAKEGIFAKAKGLRDSLERVERTVKI